MSLTLSALAEKIMVTLIKPSEGFIKCVNDRQLTIFTVFNGYKFAFSAAEINQAVDMVGATGEITVHYSKNSMPMTGDEIALTLDTELPAHEIVSQAVHDNIMPGAGGRALLAADLLALQRRMVADWAAPSAAMAIGPVHPPFVRVWIRCENREREKPLSLELVCIDRDLADMGLVDHYSVKKLEAVPDWLLERVRRLMIMPLPPPPLPVENIGCRISENVFWIYIPEGV